MQRLIPHARVSTPLGPGSVMFVRNAPPFYSRPEAVSVLLDAQRSRPQYTGTIFGAELVTLLAAQSEALR